MEHVFHRFLESPGPLLLQELTESKGSGNTVVAVWLDRRLIAKEDRRQRANCVLVFKIHLGKHEIHLPRFIVELSGFDSSPHSALYLSSAGAVSRLLLRLEAGSRTFHVCPSSLGWALPLGLDLLLQDQ